LSIRISEYSEILICRILAYGNISSFLNTNDNRLRPGNANKNHYHWQMLSRIILIRACIMRIVLIRILILIIITFRIQNFLVARLGSSLVNFSLCRQILKKVKIELAPGTKKYFMRPIRNRNWQSAPV